PAAPRFSLSDTRKRLARPGPGNGGLRRSPAGGFLAWTARRALSETPADQFQKPGGPAHAHSLLLAARRAAHRGRLLRRDPKRRCWADLLRDAASRDRITSSGTQSAGRALAIFQVLDGTMAKRLANAFSAAIERCGGSA